MLASYEVVVDDDSIIEACSEASEAMMYLENVSLAPMIGVPAALTIASEPFNGESLAKHWR